MPPLVLKLVQLLDSYAYVTPNHGVRIVVEGELNDTWDDRPYTHRPSPQQSIRLAGQKIRMAANLTLQKDRGRMAEDEHRTDKQNGERSGEQTQFEQFEIFVRKIAAVPKEELDEERAEDER